MIKKYLVAISLIGLFFFAVGCNEQTTDSKDETPFVGGTAGLLIDFVEDSPPAEVTDGGNFPFDVVVKLENDGEHFVAKEDVVLKITGIDPAEFGRTASDLTKNPDEDLEETKKDAEGNIIDGTITFVEFQNFNYLNNLSGNTPFTFKVDVCYKYGTTVNAKLCVLKDLLKPEESDVCKVNEAKTAYNSGAPVQITSFEEMVRGSDKVAFSFKIEHKGNGEIFKEDTDCDSGIRTDEDKVFVNVNTNMTGLSCSGLSNGTSGYVNLYSNDRTIICTQDLSDVTTDFEKVAVIELVYDYQEDKQKEVLVKHLIS
ncbi:hypothetical protein J4209_05465 [Candidatus Woesearchaeota archaeon]|nr:hypothetical protein [Candidatus Woesearchaeota archaeon]